MVDPQRSAPANEGAQKAAGPTHDDTAQLSIEDALRARERGQRAASSNTYEPHKRLIVDTIEAMAREGIVFTSDDVLERAGLVQPLGSTGALGALVTGAASRGVIEAVGFAQSRRPSRNGAWIRTWRGRP